MLDNKHESNTGKKIYNNFKYNRGRNIQLIQ